MHISVDKIFLMSYFWNPVFVVVLLLIWQDSRFLGLFGLQNYIPFFFSDQIGQEQIEALYQYAKFQFECGNYSGAADYLYQYRALCTNSERSLSALWGKLAAEILMQNWDTAFEELNRLKEIIDSKVTVISILVALYSLFCCMIYLLIMSSLAELRFTSESGAK